MTRCDGRATLYRREMRQWSGWTIQVIYLRVFLSATSFSIHRNIANYFEHSKGHEVVICLDLALRKAKDTFDLGGPTLARQLKRCGVTPPSLVVYLADCGVNKGIVSEQPDSLHSIDLVWDGANKTRPKMQVLPTAVIWPFLALNMKPRKRPFRNYADLQYPVKQYPQSSRLPPNLTSKP